MTTAVTLSAVIVHFRGGEHVRRCILSCAGIGSISEIIVVDNDATARPFGEPSAESEVSVIEMPANVGFGRAANAGLCQARGEGVLVLNQDVEVSADAVDAMLRAGEDAAAWVVGPRLIAPDGGVELSKAAFPAPLTWAPPAESPPQWSFVPWVAGAAMLFMPGHTDLRFDERLFMYVEDEELCWRVWAAGGRVAVANDATVPHLGGTAARLLWGRPTVIRRTLLGRARMVAWNRGVAALPAFVLGALRSSVQKRTSA